MTKARDLANGGFGLVLDKPSSVVGGTDNGKGTVSFSAATSISLNDVFSSTYNTYLIIINGTDGSSPALRMRVSGADDTGSNYSRYGAINTINISDINNTSFRFMADSAGSDPWLAKIELCNPFAAAKTAFLSHGTRHPDGYNNIISGRHQLTTSYTGCTITSSAMTGSVSVYGYNK